MKNFSKLLPTVLAVVAILIALGNAQVVRSRPTLGVSNFDSIHLRDTNLTATPNFMADQQGAGVIAEFRDGGTPVVRISDGGALSMLGGGSLVSNGILNVAPASYALTGAQTLTPTVSYYQVSPTALLTLTLSTGGASDGDILIIHNLVTTNTNIVDTGATAGGGAHDLGQDDNAGFIFGDGVWMELFSPDNS